VRTRPCHERRLGSCELEWGLAHRCIRCILGRRVALDLALHLAFPRFVSRDASVQRLHCNGARRNLYRAMDRAIATDDLVREGGEGACSRWVRDAMKSKRSREIKCIVMHLASQKSCDTSLTSSNALSAGLSGSSSGCSQSRLIGVFRRGLRPRLPSMVSLCHRDGGCNVVNV
jgi:hypothetical protein